MKKALITGITGQDGSYLSEYLLGLGYEVHGLVRRVALEDPTRRFTRLEHLLTQVTLHAASLESYPSIFHVLSKHNFDECYHLAAQSFVAESFADGFSTMNTNINGTHYMLAALRESQPGCRFYFAGSSEMFGKVREAPQNEETSFHPRSPYGISKVAGFELTRNYREAYQMHASSGILFNHESPRRGTEFVTRKITLAAARIAAGKQKELRLGNLDAQRDWGFTGDYVQAMHKMLQQPEPIDYVIGTGETHTVREFVELAFHQIGHPITWRGSGDDEQGCCRNSGRTLVAIDGSYRRPTEVDLLLGDPAKALTKLGWRHRTSFPELVAEMVESDRLMMKRMGANYGHEPKLYAAQ